MDILHLLKYPSSTYLPKSNYTWLEDDDDHQGETRKDEQIERFTIHYKIQAMATTFMPNTYVIDT